MKSPRPAGMIASPFGIPPEGLALGVGRLHHASSGKSTCKIISVTNRSSPEEIN